MPVIGEYDTLTMYGQLHGRDFIEGTTEDDHKKIYYFVVWPNMLVSLHPDYLLVHQVWPVKPGKSVIHCDWFFHPDTIARDDFDPSDAVDFWDLTNRQDWHVCELSQAGIGSPAYVPGPYSNREDLLYAFDRFIVAFHESTGFTDVPLSR